MPAPFVPSREATGADDVDATTKAILTALGLSGSGIVLDLCCGNGLISQKIMPHCGALIGVDFSAPLIDVARRLCGGSNATFIVEDATAVTPALLGIAQADAAYMASAFQCFDRDLARTLLRSVRTMAAPTLGLFIEGIPNEERRTDFYNTPERWREHCQRRAAGTEHIANWWRTSDLAELASAEGFVCHVIAQDVDLVCRSFRYDALLELS